MRLAGRIIFVLLLWALGFAAAILGVPTTYRWWKHAECWLRGPHYGLRSIPAVQFANERRRGWEEAADSPRRDPGDAWDERRNARMQKRQPGGARLLCVESRGWAGGELGVDQAVDGLRIGYWLEANGEIQLLDDLQWADWDQEGHLLVATRNGELQVRNLDGGDSEVVFEADLFLTVLHRRTMGRSS